MCAAEVRDLPACHIRRTRRIWGFRRALRTMALRTRDVTRGVATLCHIRPFCSTYTSSSPTRSSDLARRSAAARALGLRHALPVAARWRRRRRSRTRPWRRAMRRTKSGQKSKFLGVLILSHDTSHCYNFSDFDPKAGPYAAAMPGRGDGEPGSAMPATQ